MIVRDLDCPVIFLSRVAEITHKRQGIRQAELRGEIRGIDLQTRAIVLERATIVTCHSQDFAERIFRVGSARLQLRIVL